VSGASGGAEDVAQLDGAAFDTSLGTAAAAVWSVSEIARSVAGAAAAEGESSNESKGASATGPVMRREMTPVEGRGTAFFDGKCCM